MHQRQRLGTTLRIAALALTLAWLTTGCDRDLHELVHDDDDHDDTPWVKVEATLSVTVRDYDTALAVYGAKVSFYLDSGDDDHLDLDEDHPFAIVYTEPDGLASLTARAWLANPDQCIAIKAVAEYSDWTPASTGVVKFHYPDGGTRQTTLYLDRRTARSAPPPPADPGTVFAVPSSAYPTIQSAIAAAVPGDQIVVAPGRYAENLDFLGKDLAVVAAAGSAVTVLDGPPAAPTVRFGTGEGPAALLCGFTVTGGTVGIQVAGARPTLAANMVLSGITCPDPEVRAILAGQERALDELLAAGLALAAQARQASAPSPIVP